MIPQTQYKKMKKQKQKECLLAKLLLTRGHVARVESARFEEFRDAERVGFAFTLTKRNNKQVYSVVVSRFAIVFS